MAKRKNWDKATLRAAITKWKKDLQIPINKEEIDHNKKSGSKVFVKPKYKHPTLASFYKYVSRNTIKMWPSGSKLQQELHEIFEDEVKDYIIDYIEQQIIDGKVGAMFYAKAAFGYREYQKVEDKPIIINLQTENKGDNKL